MIYGHDWVHSHGQTVVMVQKLMLIMVRTHVIVENFAMVKIMTMVLTMGKWFGHGHGPNSDNDEYL